MLQGEMITSFPRTFCLSWDLEVQKERVCPQRCRVGCREPLWLRRDESSYGTPGCKGFWRPLKVVERFWA